MLQKIMVIGSGHIGKLVIKLLDNSNKYLIYVMDRELKQNKTSNFTKNVKLFNYDIHDREKCIKLFTESKIETVVSCLPFSENIYVAQIAKELNLNYFDLTEDVENTEAVKKLSVGSKAAFVPQCGLAPGFVGIAANSIATKFESVDTIKMRVGALPISPGNAFKYSFTWSAEGVVNEYCVSSN